MMHFSGSVFVGRGISVMIRIYQRKGDSSQDFEAFYYFIGIAWVYPRLFWCAITSCIVAQDINVFRRSVNEPVFRCPRRKFPRLGVLKIFYLALVNIFNGYNSISELLSQIGNVSFCKVYTISNIF